MEAKVARPVDNEGYVFTYIDVISLFPTCNLYIVICGANHRKLVVNIDTSV